ncbi:tubulin epsilon and delta complex protein 2-like [Patiria miniata]|uniref:Uncharacterized protein n=1 Tax=Patiria miniata TaxID=46514 RepID=A0A914AXJ5_PATMI|nr:tubulin epsilon and delta complex protein 2-like [Patiria miniata]
MDHHFDRIEQFITDVTLCVETSRDLCERICQDFRPLLNRPWPPKAKPAKSGGPLAGDGDAGNHGDAASLEEAETLAEVEKALVKAQRARQLQKRLNPLEELCQEQGTEATAADQTTGGNAPSEPTSQVIDGQDFAVISHSSLKKLFADVKPRNSEKSGANSAPKPRPGTAQARAAYSAKVPRPKPLAKSHFKTTSSEIGRNVTAKPVANSAGNKAMKPKIVGAQNARESTATRNFSKGKGPNTAVNGTKKPNSAGGKNALNADKSTAGNQKNGRPMLDNKKNTSAIREKRNGDFPDAGNKGSQKSVGVPKQPSEMADEHKHSVNGMAKVVQKTAGLRLSEGSSATPSSSETGDCGKSAQADGAKPFMLKRDGHTLKLPGKLKKLQSDISKLRQRLSSKMESEEQSLPSQHFRLRLESKFQQSSTSPLSRDIQERIVELTTECNHLIHVAKSALNDFPKHGNASWDSRYRLHVLTKALRTKLDELKGEVENVAEGEVSFSHEKPGLPHVSQPYSSDCCTHENVSYHPSTTFFLPVRHRDLQGCTEYLDPTGQHDHRNYEYSHLRELQRLATLQHDVQRLSLQIQLEKLIGQEILPMMENLDSSDSSCTALYRSLYGLLCHGGQLYPAVVADNVGSASMMETT